MDVPTLMYNLREEVTCSVCIQLYTNPKQLPCLHIFCLRCLNNLARTSAQNGKIKCPLCQREVAVPESGTLETLPNCFHMKNLLDILAIKECNNAKVACENCGRKSEEAAYCFHCGKLWCNDCVNAHNIFRENRDHRVLALKDFEDKDFEDVLKRPVLCQKELHDKEVLKFYCKECDIPVCQTCVIVDHNKHDVEHLEFAAREVKKRTTSTLDAARESSKPISHCLTELERKLCLLEHRSKINKERIQHTVHSLMLSLRQKEKESILEVESQTMKAQQQIREMKDKLQDQLDKRNYSISKIETLVQRSPAAELVRTKTIINEMCQGLQQPEDIQSTAVVKDTSTVFFENEDISKIINELRIGHFDEVETETELKECSLEEFKEGRVGLESQFEIITRNSNREQYYCPADVITVDIISKQCGTSAEVQITDKKNGRYIISYIPRKVGQHLLNVQVNGETLVGEFPTLEVKERFFKPIRFIAEESIEGTNLRPWGITVNESNQMFVSDMHNDRVVVFRENGEFIKSFGHNTLHCPNGVICDNTGKIYVVSRNDNKILLFWQNGEYFATVHNGEVLREPRGIALDPQGNLIVCDTGNECVQLISPNGNILKSIGRGRLPKPFDCLYFEDKIFVSDLKAHLIKVYSSNGRFLYEFGRRWNGDGEFIEPSGLATDKTGHLVVCSDHKVQLFTTDGTFVTQFGVYGNLMGQMKSPLTASVMKNGQLVICEMENLRLQVFG